MESEVAGSSPVKHPIARAHSLTGRMGGYEPLGVGSTPAVPTIFY